jgi:peptide chain release factor subunit 1
VRLSFLPARLKRQDPRHPRVAILTPVKDVEDQAKAYFRRLRRLTFPHENITIRLLESDSRDRTHAAFQARARRARWHFRSIQVFKHDFRYQIPEGVPRWAAQIQQQRRAVLALSRNRLLFLGLQDADWALWLDADVIEFPPDLIERLLAFGKDIVQPHCVKEYGGPTYDTNGWSHGGTRHLHDHRGAGLVRLTAVGGTVLLVRADRHRDGLIFPPFLYGQASPLMRASNGMSDTRGEIETEGLGLLAADMNLECWGAPDLEVIHRNA